MHTGQVVRDEAGKLQRVASWDSQGSDLVQYNQGAPAGAAAVDTAPRKAPDDDSSPGVEEAASAECAPGYPKTRRAGAKEVVYTRVTAFAGATPPAV